MVLNQDVDAIIVSAISNRKNIDQIDCVEITLKAISALGNISSHIANNKSPSAYLTPLFLYVTLLARKANVNTGLLLSRSNLFEPPLYNRGDIAATQILLSLHNLNCCAGDIQNHLGGGNYSKDELKFIIETAIKSTYLIMLNIEIIAEQNNSSMEKIQKNTLKHLHQLIKLI